MTHARARHAEEKLSAPPRRRLWRQVVSIFGLEENRINFSRTRPRTMSSFCGLEKRGRPSRAISAAEQMAALFCRPELVFNCPVSLSSRGSVSVTSNHLALGRPKEKQRRRPLVGRLGSPRLGSLRSGRAETASVGVLSAVQSDDSLRSNGFRRRLLRGAAAAADDDWSAPVWLAGGLSRRARIGICIIYLSLVVIEIVMSR